MCKKINKIIVDFINYKIFKIKPPFERGFYFALEELNKGKKNSDIFNYVEIGECFDKNSLSSKEFNKGMISVINLDINKINIKVDFFKDNPDLIEKIEKKEINSKQQLEKFYLDKIASISKNKNSKSSKKIL